ncbi:3-ketosteroid-delta-1-dehydrogenase [Myroides fluvii]|uniref:3-ketosteroid-delta-1-dehydrogenase n=1 Tax=Myroides fluvii TaxID=2572594 RepID=UPI00131BADAF|nr:3-ketosteroid-delta-1-dehydrogenase [Myroides fluvii]
MKKTKVVGPILEDQTVDLLVVGSGTGLTAALAAHEFGLSTLVVEKTPYVGGSTALSGGAFWIPGNQVLQEDGSKDQLEEGEKYLNALVKKEYPRARWQAFLQEGNATIAMLYRQTALKFFWAKGYSDYHPETPGGSARGRTCESKPFNLNRLGVEKKRFRYGKMEAPLPMPVTGYDYKWMNLMLKKPLKAFPIILKRLFQGVGGLLIGKKLVAGGQAIAAGMFDGVIRAGIPVYTQASLIALLYDGTRITGAVVRQKDKDVTIHTKRGVVLAAGGFDHNMPMRQHYQSPHLVANLSFGAEGNTGDAITMAEQLGGVLDNMKESWWFPAVAPLKKGGDPQVLLAERSLPGSFMINAKGKRFINEATDYMTFGQTLLKLEREQQAVGDMWLIFDQKYRNQYLLAGAVFPMMNIPREWYEAKIAFKARNAQDLAKQMGISEKIFIETYQRFNTLAQKGRDEDFHKGESAYDQYYGDPTVKPNPCLRPLKGNLYAVKVVLSDLGTCGGLMTDENGVVLRENQQKMEGLYAIGNTAANVFGQVYPGAGATIGQGMVFGYIAAKHAASIQQNTTQTIGIEDLK